MDQLQLFELILISAFFASLMTSSEIGPVKNTNKNRVAEKAIQESESELLRQEPSGGHLSSLTQGVVNKINLKTDDG